MLFFDLIIPSITIVARFKEFRIVDTNFTLQFTILLRKQSRLSNFVIYLPSLESTINSLIGYLLILLRVIQQFNVTNFYNKIFSLQSISNKGLQPLFLITKNSFYDGSLLDRLLNSLKYRLARFQQSLQYQGPKLVTTSMLLVLYLDYRKDIISVYTQFIRFSIYIVSRMLDILNYVQYNDEPRSRKYPSQMPKQFKLDSYVILHGYSTSINGGGPIVHDNTLQGSFQNPRILSLDRVYIDAVYTISEVIVLVNSILESIITLIEPIQLQLFLVLSFLSSN